MVVKSIRFIFCLAFIAGCATGVETGDDCQSDDDCQGNLSCNKISQECESIRLDPNNKKPDMNVIDRDMGTLEPDTSSKPDTPPISDLSDDQSQNIDMNSNDAAADMSEPDMKKACEPSCSAAEKCEEGICVEACNPTCVAPKVCTETGCKFPTCSQKGDRCETTETDQGNFLCRDLGNGGECLSKCTELGADTCASGEYCIPTNGQFNCEASQCSQQSDCAGGSCFLFDNDYGRCFAAGNLSENAVCDLGGSTCAAGLTCGLKVGAAAGEGTCQKICSPWAASTGCTGGARCSNFVTPRSFSCSPDNDATGSTAYSSCTTPNASCSDATRCIELASSNGCFQYCRPGSNDCAGLSVESSCNNRLIAGEDRWGLCLGKCNNQEDCGDGRVCNNEICRQPCTDATTVVADCCNGNAVDCNWTCNAGLCE